jgi:plasmid stabilization system protein ParE
VIVEFHPEAEDEMIESGRFYEERSEGLGTDFLAAIQDTIRRIQQFPDPGSTERAGIRRRLVSGFPFTVLYEKQQDRIFIGAVMHQHRRPGYWRGRFGG